MQQPFILAKLHFVDVGAAIGRLRATNRRPYKFYRQISKVYPVFLFLLLGALIAAMGLPLFQRIALHGAEDPFLQVGIGLA